MANVAIYGWAAIGTTLHNKLQPIHISPKIQFTKGSGTKDYCSLKNLILSEEHWQTMLPFFRHITSEAGVCMFFIYHDQPQRSSKLIYSKHTRLSCLSQRNSKQPMPIMLHPSPRATWSYPHNGALIALVQALTFTTLVSYRKTNLTLFLRF